MAHVIMYSKPWCSYCAAAKRLLADRGVAFEEVDIESWSGEKIEDLFRRSGMRTVPQIFADDKLIGGCDELLAKDRAKGGLDSLK